ncbi:hypothetical protein SynA15127_01944 [Synechococcus sp. A15-127]|nr:hypothetical protein SynA15127_01944 [Synechococcus sp. A15-127]
MSAETARRPNIDSAQGFDRSRFAWPDQWSASALISVLSSNSF